MKRLEVLQLLAHAGELDRLACHRLEAQRRAAPRIAVQFRQNRPGDVQGPVEVGGHIDRFLSGGRVEDKQSFLRLDQIPQPRQLLHQWLVNLQPAGGIENERVAIGRARRRQRLARNLEHVGLAVADENRQLQLLAEFFQLVHRRRAVHIGPHQQRRASLFVQQPPQLGAGSGLAGAVQAHQQDATGIATQQQTGVGRAE